ncbi:MAG: metallophosphoesterase [Paludibacter sp.]
MKKYNIYTLITFLLIISTGIIFGQQKVKLIILHTNDTHSQVEPTDNSTSKTANMGGYARRMGMIDSIRSIEKNVLLVDAGDFSQGTPYFNFFNGRVEINAMNKMKYDAVTIGNHEFDNGIDTLAVILKAAKFPILSSNYVVDNTPLTGMLKPYLILERSGLQIGIITTNVEPRGLIIENNYKGLIYKNALKTANEIAAYLKQKKHCDVIICLSHLGVVPDYETAHKSSDIDVIIGGHSHTLLENAIEKNKVGKWVIIAQMGKSGLYLGKVELELEKK